MQMGATATIENNEISKGVDMRAIGDIAKGAAKAKIEVR